MCVVNKPFEFLEVVFDPLDPFMLTCSMMKFLSLLLLGLCVCDMSIIMWSSLVYCSTICGCGGCSDGDACTVVCLACMLR